VRTQETLDEQRRRVYAAMRAMGAAVQQQADAYAAAMNRFSARMREAVEAAAKAREIKP
jgi:hypothetical protein